MAVFHVYQLLAAIMAKEEREKSKRAKPSKATHPRPPGGGKAALIMCVVSILLIGGTIYSQVATHGHVHIDCSLVITELGVLGVTIWAIFLWLQSLYHYRAAKRRELARKPRKFRNAADPNKGSPFSSGNHHP